MTRFARAHGSKASNERLPEEATSWNVLKQQLLEQQAASKQKVEEASKPIGQPSVFQKIKGEVTEWAEFEDVPDPKQKKLAKKKEKLAMSQKKFVDRLSLDEQHSSKSKLHKIKNESKRKNCEALANSLKQIKGLEKASQPSRPPFVCQKIKSEVTEWAEIEEVPGHKDKTLGIYENKLVDRLLCDEQHSNKIRNHNDIQNGKTLTKKMKKIKVEEVQTQNSDAPEDEEPVRSKAKPKVKLSIREKRKNKLKVSENSVKSFNPDTTDARGELKTSESVDGSEHKLTKRQLKRKKHMLKKQQDDGFVFKHPQKVDTKKKPKQGEPLEDRNGEEGEPNLTKRQRKKRKSLLKQQLGPTLSDAAANEDVETTDQTQSNSKLLQVQSKRQKRNLKKLGDPTKVKERRQRKTQVQSTTLVINGQEIEVTKFDGFPVRKEDADRLKELRKQMTTNGIPPEEIEATMKTERRKAEKALSQQRRKVCFHCRKGGHNLSDCPELIEGSNQDAAATSGICFKCGSTEHTHFECRVVRGQEFRFAKCFICQEQGHISRQCPDNPRGLYPKGGGCKVCGDVTHLKKDCPDLHEKKEQNVITLNTARSDRLEALDEDLRVEDNGLAVLPQKSKVVKF